MVRGWTAMGGATVSALAAILACSQTGAAAAPPEPVVVPMTWASAGELSLPPRVLELSDVVPRGVAAPMHADGVRYTTVPFGEAALAIGVDLRDGSERIWLDHDLDGDLGDDARAWWTRTGDGWERVEHLLVSDASAVAQRYAAVQVRCAERGAPVTLAHSLCRTGSALLGGRMRRSVLLDGDHDARFDSPDDRLLVDLDGDGHLDAERERVAPGRAFAVAGEGWLVEPPSSTGAELFFARSETVPEVPGRTWVDIPPPPSGVLPPAPDESLDELLEQLDASPRPPAEKRLQLIARIGRVGTAEAFAALEHRVHTGRSAAVRAAAVRAMGNPLFMGEHVDDVVRLTDRSTTGDPSQCVAALEALHAMGWPGRERLLRRLLTERQWAIAGGAARHLAYLPDAESRELAVAACTSLTWSGSTRAAWSDRLSAYRGVRTLPGGPAPDLMVEMAQSAHPALMALALEDLRSIDHPETVALARRAARFTSLIWNPIDTPIDPVEMSSSVLSLVRGRRDLGTVLIRLLASGDDPESVASLLLLVGDAPPARRDALREQLAARRSDESVGAVLHGLEAHDVGVRELVAEALADIPGPVVTRALVQRLEGERDDRVRFALLGALRRHRDPSTAGALLALSAEGPLRGFALRAATACGPDDPRVLRVLLAHLRSDDWEQRVRGALAVRETRDRDLVSRVVPLLSDERWSVRVAAIDTLRVVRTRASVAPLIARLADEERLRLQLAIADALFALTGMDLGADAEPWRVWHDEHAGSFEVPRQVPERRLAVTSTTAAFFGLPVDSDHATFVLDRSGSMRAPMAPPEPLSRLHASMDEASGAVGGMPDAAFVNLVLFHMSAKSWKNRLVPLTKGNRSAFGRRVRSALLGPQTDVFRALRTALRDPDSDTILLLTDGLPNTGDHVEPADLLFVVALMNETSQVAIHCVSMGTDAELLRRLAARNAGRHVRR